MRTAKSNIVACYTLQSKVGRLDRVCSYSELKCPKRRLLGEVLRKRHRHWLESCSDFIGSFKGETARISHRCLNLTRVSQIALKTVFEHKQIKVTVTICVLRQASVQCYFITLTLLQNGLRPFTYLHMNGKTVF